MKLHHKKQDLFIPTKIPLGLFGLKYSMMGGFFESIGERGVSHILEHLICKTFDDMREELQSLGIEHNAYTADNNVCIYFSGLTESLSEVCERIYNKIIVQDSLWTKESFENEKNTVLQEYGDTFNSQESGFYYNLLRKYYNYCGPIGYKNDIESFTYEQSLDRAKKFITPSIICQVGGYFVPIPVTMKSTSDFTSVVNKKQVTFGSYDLNQEVVPKDGKTIVGLLGKNPISIDKVQMMLFIISCINTGLGAPLYTEIREKRGLSYYSSGDALYVGDQCFPLFFSSTSAEEVTKLEDVYNAFFSLDGNQVISRDRFNTCKKFYAVKEKMAQILPSSGAMTTILSGINPFTGVDSFTYDTVIENYNLFMKLDNYILVKY